MASHIYINRVINQGYFIHLHQSAWNNHYVIGTSIFYRLHRRIDTSYLKCYGNQSIIIARHHLRRNHRRKKKMYHHQLSSARNHVGVMASARTSAASSSATSWPISEIINHRWKSRTVINQKVMAQLVKIMHHQHHRHRPAKYFGISNRHHQSENQLAIIRRLHHHHRHQWNVVMSMASMSKTSEAATSYVYERENVSINNQLVIGWHRK